ncbi:surface antigen repeat-containing protein [Besnoitia besnoiti]|uniref:Surface antigen repeat-containing protein n=1 Tax=Besnoitia besnoiti TaxID=94643 RepID=A0A2A9MDC1_BESBE|nr:surface antigen repeat-containing protein [Besnoitia besnoiti]PFH36498.1 surface antigen repeat-containing protein [Besnoitia besnoiti]
MSTGIWKIFKRKGKDGDEEETKATKAHMGEENKMYYNEKLKRWVVKGEEHLVEQEQLPPPPPKAAPQAPEGAAGGPLPSAAGPRGFARGRGARSLYTATPGLNVKPSAAPSAAVLPKPGFVLPPFAAAKPPLAAPPLPSVSAGDHTPSSSSALPPPPPGPTQESSEPQPAAAAGAFLAEETALTSAQSAEPFTGLQASAGGETDTASPTKSAGGLNAGLSEAPAAPPSLPLFSSFPVACTASHAPTRFVEGQRDSLVAAGGVVDAAGAPGGAASPVFGGDLSRRSSPATHSEGRLASGGGASLSGQVEERLGGAHAGYVCSPESRRVSGASSVHKRASWEALPAEEGEKPTAFSPPFASSASRLSSAACRSSSGSVGAALPPHLPVAHSPPMEVSAESPSRADGLSVPSSFPPCGQPPAGADAGLGGGQGEASAPVAGGFARGALSVTLESSSSEDDTDTASPTLRDGSSDDGVSWREGWHTADGAQKNLGGGAERGEGERPYGSGRPSASGDGQALLRGRQQRNRRRGNEADERHAWRDACEADRGLAGGSTCLAGYAAALREWRDGQFAAETVSGGAAGVREDAKEDQEQTAWNDGDREEEGRQYENTCVKESEVRLHKEEIRVDQNRVYVQQNEVYVHHTGKVHFQPSLPAAGPGEEQPSLVSGAADLSAVRPPQIAAAGQERGEDFELDDPWSSDRRSSCEGAVTTLQQVGAPNASAGGVPPVSGPPQVAQPPAAASSPSPAAASHLATGSTSGQPQAAPPREPVTVEEEGAASADAWAEDGDFGLDEYVRSVDLVTSPVSPRPSPVPLQASCDEFAGTGDPERPARSVEDTRRTQVFDLAETDDAEAAGLPGVLLRDISAELYPSLASREAAGGAQTEGGVERSAGARASSGAVERPPTESKRDAEGDWWRADAPGAEGEELDAVDLFYRSDEDGGRQLQAQAAALAGRGAAGLSAARRESAEYAQDAASGAFATCSLAEETHAVAGPYRGSVLKPFSASVEDMERTSGAALEQLQEQRRVRLELEGQNALLQRQLHAVLVLLSRFSLSREDKRRLNRLLRPAASSPKSGLLRSSAMQPREGAIDVDGAAADAQHAPRGEGAPPQEERHAAEGEAFEKHVNEKPNEAAAPWPTADGDAESWEGMNNELLDDDVHATGAERFLALHALSDAEPGRFFADEEDADFDADVVEADEVREAFNTLTQLLAEQLERQSSSRAELEVCQAEAEGYLLLVEQQQKHVIEPLCRHVETLQREQEEEQREVCRLQLLQAELQRLYEGVSAIAEDLRMQLQQTREREAAQARLAAELQAQLQAENEKKANMQAALHMRERELQEARLSCDSFRTQLEDAREKLQRAQGDFERRERELGDTQAEERTILLREKEEALRAGAEQVVLLQESLRTKQREASQSEAEVVSLREQLRALQANLDRAQGELASTQESLRKLGEKLREKDADCARWQEVERHRQQGEAELARLREDLARAQTDAEATRAAHAAEKAKLVEDQRHHAELALAAAREEAAKRTEETNREINALRDQLADAVASEQRTHEEKERALGLQLAEAREEAERLRRETHELRGAGDALRMQLEAAQAEHRQAAAGFEERLRDAVKSKQEASGVERQRAEEAHAVALESLRASLTRELEAQAETAGTQVAALETRVRQAEAELERERQAHAEALRLHEAMLASEAQTREEIEEEMKNKDAEIEVLNAMQDELQQQMAGLREACARLEREKGDGEEARQRRAEEEETRRRDEAERAAQALEAVKQQLAQEKEEEKAKLRAELEARQHVLEHQTEESKRLAEERAAALAGREREAAEMQLRLDTLFQQVEVERQEKARYERMLGEREGEWRRQADLRAAEDAQRADETRLRLESVEARLAETEAAQAALQLERDTLEAALREKDSQLLALPRQEDLEAANAQLAVQEQELARLRQELDAKAQQSAATEAAWQEALREEECKRVASEERLREELRQETARLQAVIEAEKKKAASEEAERLRQTYEKLWDEESQKMLKAYEGVATRLQQAQLAMQAREQELETLKKTEAEMKEALERADRAQEAAKQLQQTLNERDAEVAQLRTTCEEQSASLARLAAEQKKAAEAADKEQQALEEELMDLRLQVANVAKEERERKRDAEEREESLRRVLQEREDAQRESDLRLQVLQEQLEADREKHATAERRRAEEIQTLKEALSELKAEKEDEKTKAQEEAAEHAAKLCMLEEAAARQQKHCEELTAELEEARRVPPTVEGVKKESVLVAKQNEELRMRAATLSSTSDFLSRRLQFFENALDSLGPSGRAIMLEADRSVQPPEPVEADAASEIADAVLSSSLTSSLNTRRASLSLASPSSVRSSHSLLGAAGATPFGDFAVDGGVPGDPVLDRSVFHASRLNLHAVPLAAEAATKGAAPLPPRPPAFMQSFLRPPSRRASLSGAGLQ